jgi:hypothetical protein
MLEGTVSITIAVAGVVERVELVHKVRGGKETSGYEGRDGRRWGRF